MEKCRYILLENRLPDRVCYGIAAIVEYDGCAVVMQTYADLCADRDAAVRFVELCNAQELSLCHLPDAAEDFAAEQ